MGVEAVATGGDLNRDLFNQKKQQYDALFNEIHQQNQIIAQKDQSIAANNSQIEMINAALAEYEHLKNIIDDKNIKLNDLTAQKNAKEGEIQQHTTRINELNTQLSGLRKNGSADQYVNFFDFLTQLDWRSAKSEADLAVDLKTRVDNTFSNVFNNFQNSDYQKVIELYKRREGQITGSSERLRKELSDIDAGSEFHSAKVETYYNSFDTEKGYANDFNLVYPQHNQEYPRLEKYFTQDNGFISKFFDMPDSAELAVYSGIFHSLRNSYRESEFLLTQDVRKNNKNNNTKILINSSLSKAKKKNEFTPLLPITNSSIISAQNNGRNFIMRTHDIYLSKSYRYNKTSPIFTEEFFTQYNQKSWDNYSQNKKVRFGFKGVNGNDVITPIGFDINFEIMEKIADTSTDFENLVSSSDITTFKDRLDYLKQYQQSIDWDYADSVINLTDYKTRLENVITYNDKISNFLSLYEEIIEERKKPNGGDEARLNEKSRKLLALKSDILQGALDINNYLANIELKIDEDKARQHLFYGKDIADPIVRGLVDELKLYDPNDGLIKGVNDKINELKQQYLEANADKNLAEGILSDINEEIERNQLTPEERLNAQNIANKTNEKQQQEAKKAQLEEEKRNAEIALANAKSALANTQFANIGKNSYAQGTQAFASGNHAIAIGTQAEALAENALALGHLSQAKAPNSVAVGASGKLRQITHVAAGLNDTDAVNVWQLKAAIANLPNAQQPTSVSNSIQVTLNQGSGNKEIVLNSAEEAIRHLNEQGTKYVHVNGASAREVPQDRSNGDSSASGAYAVAIGHLANALGENSLALGKDAEASLSHSVALGDGSKTTNIDETTAGVSNYGSAAVIDQLNNQINQFSGANAIGVISVGDKGKTRRIQHVATGLISHQSTDAVNGSQLYALASAINSGGFGLVRQKESVETINQNPITIGAETGGSEVNFSNKNAQSRRLSGVANGVQANDAVNKGQLDQAIGQVNQRISKLSKVAKGGIANAIAVASMPQAYSPSQNVFSVGTGSYKGENALAIGLSRISDNGKLILKLNGSVSQKEDLAIGAGVGFAW